MVKFRHYKGGEYELVCEGVDEASLEPVVVYKSMYSAKDFPAGTIWVRKKKIFDEELEFEGQMVKRFSIVEE